jgi:hypothetical protein
MGIADVYDQWEPGFTALHEALQIKTINNQSV